MHKINFKNKLSLLVFALFFFCFTQNTWSQTKTYNEEITVVAPYDPIIPDAFKISFNPTVNDTITSLPTMKYNIMPRIADVKPEIEKLPAVKLVAEPISKLYRNYVKVGVGNNSALYGELFSSTLRSKKSLFTIRLKHQSASGKIKSFGPPQNSRNEVVLSASKFFDLHSLSGKAYYFRDAVHLYGYNINDIPFIVAKDDIRQHFFRSGAEAEFASNYKTDDKLNHVFGLSYYYMAGGYDNKENNFRFTTSLDKKVDLFKLDEDQTLGILAGYDHLTQKDSITKINSGILLINPFIKAQVNEYSFKAGIKMNVSMDTLTKAHIYPILEARLELIPGALKLFAGIGGGIERISLKNTVAENPFVSSILPWSYVNDKFNAYGGIQSNISRSFNFNASISSSTYENYPFFVTDTSALLLNSFTYLFDDISVVRIKGELEFIKSSRIRLATVGTYNIYSMGLQEYAWYKPAYELELTGRYDIQNKIILTAKATINSSVWALVPQQTPIVHLNEGEQYTFDAQKIKGWFDINLGAEYKFNKALSFWLNFNNLTNSRYYRWYNYKSYGINLLGGLSYSF